MLRDNPTGSSQQCLENPRPAGAELSLTEDVTSPFQAEPRHSGFEGVSGVHILALYCLLLVLTIADRFA